MTQLKQRLNLQPSSESGFNLIESLVAMIVVSTLMIAVAPVIVYSVGTRVQARRIELATQAAGSYIDAIRAGTIDPPTPGSTPPTRVAAPATGSLDCKNSSQLCTTPMVAGSPLYCVDFDGDKKCSDDSVTDMVVQGIAYNPNSTEPDNGFCLGVRVYRANSLASGVTLQSPPTQSDQVSTNAIGNIELPLLQMTTERSPQNQTGGGTRLDAMRDRIDPSGSGSGSSCGN
ncbi:MAG: hormogonium polysaccharide secretion pseudopilin HpsB [Limnoraphis sp.]